MRKKTMMLIALLFVGMVILPGFTLSSNGKENPVMGCGNIPGELGDWLEEDNVAHVYFSQVDPEFEGKNGNEAWAKMSYTFCGMPSRFVFNGHGLERNMPYALIAVLRVPEGMMMPQPEPSLLGEAESNGGGNVHIKGSLPGGELFPWDIYLVRAGMWEAQILASNEPVSWTPECEFDDVCDEGVLMAELSGGSQVPPVMTEASGNAIFYDNGAGGQLAFILQASDLGTVTSAHVHYGAMGSNGPAVAALFSGSDSSGDFLTAGMVMESGLMGDFAGSPVSALIAAMDEGMTYVNVHTEAWPAGEIRGQVERIDISGFCDDIDDDTDDDADDDCREECLEECPEGYPETSMEICRQECMEICGDDDDDEMCEPTVDSDDPFFGRFEGISLDNMCETDEDCMVGGCSGEVCAAEPAITTCEVLPYQPEGGCLCVEGVCQWMECDD